MFKGLFDIKEAQSLFVLGMPLIGGLLVGFAIHVTDVLMLGRYSVMALAQVTIATQVVFIFYIIGTGFAGAVLPMVAKAAKQHNYKRVRRVTRMGLWLSCLLGGALIIVMWYAKPLLLMLGQDQTVTQGAQDYLRIAGFGLIPALCALVLRNYLTAQEHTSIIFWLSVITLLANIIINYLLIFGNFGFPELGVRGAAIASLLVQLILLLGFILYIQYYFAAQGIFRRLWRADWGAIIAVTKLAVPISLTMLAEVGLFTASTFMMGVLGVVELAAHSITLQLAALVFMVHLGLSQAATVRVGQAWAHNNVALMKTTARAALLLSVFTSCFVIVLFVSLPVPLLSLFLDSSANQRSEIIQLGIIFMAMAAAFQFVDGAQAIALGVLRGVQDTKRPMFIAALSYWGIGVSISFVLGFMTPLGAIGIWLGLLAGLSGAAVLLWHRYIRLLHAFGKKTV